MITREEQAFHSAFSRAAATADAWPVPDLPNLPRDAASPATPAALIASEPDVEADTRWFTSSWLVAAAIALALLTTSAALIQRYSAAPRVSPQPGTQAPVSSASQRPVTAASPCSRVPALSPLGAIPTSADRIWLCGDGWDQVSLDADAAAAALAALGLVRPTNSEGCYEYLAAPPMRVYFDTGPQRRGYTIGGTCPLASRELATLEAAFQRAHGAPQFPVLAADICQTTSMSPRAITHISVVAVCTDSFGTPLASGRQLPQPGLLDQAQLDELTGPIAQALLPIVDPDVELPTRSDGPADVKRWVALRVSDGTSVDTWYLVGDQIWVSGYPRAFHARPSVMTAKMLWEVADRP